MMLCESKSRYASYGAANQNRRARQKANSAHLLIYFCEDCHGWHLTSRKANRITGPARRRL